MGILYFMTAVMGRRSSNKDEDATIENNGALMGN